MAIDLDDLVTGFQSNVFTNGTHLKTSVIVYGIFQNECISIDKSQCDKNQDTNHHVHDNAAKHHNQSLPGWFRSELPWLRFLTHRLCVEGFVNHSGNFYIATQRNGTDSILGFTLFKRPDFWWEPN